MCAREVTLRAKSGDIYGPTRLSQRETGERSLIFPSGKGVRRRFGLTMA